MVILYNHLLNVQKMISKFYDNGNFQYLANLRVYKHILCTVLQYKHYNLHHQLITISKPSSVNLEIISNISELNYLQVVMIFDILFNDKKIINQVAIRKKYRGSSPHHTLVWALLPSDFLKTILGLIIERPFHFWHQLSMISTFSKVRKDAIRVI